VAQRMIAGRYRLLEQLGAGALWHAEDTELEREVTVRLLSSDERASPAVQLSHPSIVRVFDHGEEDGERFEVQEFVPGATLAQRLERGRLTTEEAERVSNDVAAALAYAHDLGIVHGSLGPESVLIDPDGRAKVTGFGGEGTPEDDLRAAAALVPAVAAAEPVTEVLPAAVAPDGSRRLVLLATAAAVALAAAGVGAALLASTSGGNADPGTSARVVPISTRTGDTTPPEAPPPTTSEETTTSTTAATTTEPETTAPATTETLPLPTTVPLPTTTVELPPTTEEPLPTTSDGVTTVELP
jgi:eukaryotic-like serine/threonine-protein kinase